MPSKPFNLRTFLFKEVKRSQIILRERKSRSSLPKSGSEPNLRRQSLEPSPLFSFAPPVPPTRNDESTHLHRDDTEILSSKELSRHAQLQDLLTQHTTTSSLESRQQRNEKLSELREELADLIEEELTVDAHEKFELALRKEVLIGEIKKLEDEGRREKMARSRVNDQFLGILSEPISPFEKKKLARKAAEVERLRNGIIKPAPKRRRSSLSEGLDGEDLLKLGKIINIKKRQNKTDAKMRKNGGKVIGMEDVGMGALFEENRGGKVQKDGKGKMTKEQKKARREWKKVMGFGEKVQKWLE